MLTASASLGFPDAILETSLAATALGQSAQAEDDAKAKQRHVADLLHRARQAMDENDLATAETLIAKAEALDVQYGWYYTGDTPKKARRDLERKRRSSSPVKPSKLFAPFGANKNKQAPGSDPFAGHAVETTSQSAASGNLTPLPTIEPLPSPAPSHPAATPPYATTQPGANGAHAPRLAATAADSPLRVARLALAVGDVRRASEFVSRARAAHASYRPEDDTPDKVESAIKKHVELAGLDKNSEAYARAYVRNLMEQADALVYWGEYDEAERLAGRAAGVKLVYGPFEQKPYELLKRIAAMRKQAATPQSPPSEAGFATASAPPANASVLQRAVQLVRLAREAIAAGDLNRAETLARQADAMRVPDSAFAPGEDRPGLVLLDLAQLRRRGDASVTPAAGVEGGNNGASPALYDSNNDPTRNVPASDRRMAQAPSRYQPTPPAPAPVGAAGNAQTPGMSLFQQGEEALRNHDAGRAYEFFRQAAQYPNDLDPVTAQRLQDHLQLLSAPSRAGAPAAGRTPTLLDEAAMRQQMLYRQVAADLAHRESNARAMQDADPQAALQLLEEARRMVASSGLDSLTRARLLRRVDRAIAETQQIIEKNRPQIERGERNRRVEEEVERGRRVKVEVQEKLAMLIDQYNRLMHEQRFEEAQVVAKQCGELDPDNPVVRQVLINAKLVNNLRIAKAIQNEKEENFVIAMDNVDRASTPFNDNNPYQFPDIDDWRNKTHNRKKFEGALRRPHSEREIEIEKRLRTPVSLQFTAAPLRNVLDYLGKVAEVNVHLDPQGLAEEGVTTDTPVTIDLRNEIMLESALNLILHPLHLSYVIQDEVLKITSEQMRDGQVYQVVYNVADLVVPIPNFVPTSMGLGAEYDAAMSNVGFGGSVPFGSATATPLAVVASHDGERNGAAIDPNLLAQIGSSSRSGLTGGQQGTPVGPGPGGLGGGVEPDFDSLIELITRTVAPTTWDEVGGAGTIEEFERNLSIVVSQTQEVHQQLADLLEQLRRLQDLQVTIEVRFITLNDNFFERIGVDFDFDINDNLDGKGVEFGARNSAGYVSNPAEFTVGQGVPRDVTD
ncbi:MAG: hypothetical protein JW959_04790, partial [Pirellulales bacterium]|nr:hypothetical protein [Pirellulales bacterium]